MTNTKTLLAAYRDSLRAFDKKQPHIYDYWTTKEFKAFEEAEEALIDRDRTIESLLVQLEELGGLLGYDATEILNVLRGNAV